MAEEAKMVEVPIKEQFDTLCESIDKEIVSDLENAARSLGYFPDGTPVQPSDVGIPLSTGDDERTLPGDPLPIAGNPLSGAGDALERHVEIMRAYPKVETKPGPYGGIVVSPTTSEMTPAQQRAARARAARQANLAARRSA